MSALNNNFILENINIKKIKALHYCQKNGKISKITNIFIIGAKNM
jgi:hypothetical protein